MNIEEFEELINSIPKVKSDNPPVSTMNSINVEDLRNTIKRFKKISSYQELLEENQELLEENTRLTNEITVLKIKNKKLKEIQCTFLGTGCQNKMKEYKELMDILNFIKDRSRSDATQETINKLAISFINNWLKKGTGVKIK